MGMKYYRHEFRAMGCSHEIIICAQDPETASRAMSVAEAEVRRIEGKYSRYRADSIISEINARAGESAFVKCDEETMMLLRAAQALHVASDGLFDITSGVLRRIWNFSVGVCPTQSQIDALLPLIGWDMVELHEDSVRLRNPGMEIDFGGFGKEYACDRAAEAMAAMGIDHGYVNLAGDIRALGPQPDGSPWLIGVQHPREQGRALAKFPLTRGALATSGDYEKYFEVGGRRYCHILNPLTGHPVHYWASATTLAATALIAGACTTIAMLKEAAGTAYLEKTRRPFILVDLAGRWVTDTESKQLETT